MARDARSTFRGPLVAVAALFFVNGITIGSWLPRLPEVRARLGVSESVLGLVLVGTGLGGLAVSLTSGAVVDRLGSRRVAVLTSVALSTLMPLVGVASVAPALFVVLIAFGAFDGLTDVAMNAQAVLVQGGLRRAGRTTGVMTRLHGMWSLGAVLGGVLSALAAGAGVSIRDQLLLTAAFSVTTTLVARSWLVPDRRGPDGPHVAGTPLADGIAMPASPTMPARRVPAALFARLFALGVAVALAEAPPNDWAALSWVDHFGVSEGRAALAYVAIATGMVTGRFSGDLIVARVGTERTRRGGAALGALGVAVAAAAPDPWPLAGLGLFLTGFGVSQLFPLMIGAASEMTAGSAQGMAAFSSGARLGFLVGPPLVGTLAGAWSVTTAVLVVSGISGVVVAAARLHRPP